MTATQPEPLGWFSAYSEQDLRAALHAAAADLAAAPLTFGAPPDLTNPLWAACRATVGERAFAKFAFSEPTAARIWREAQVLALLRDDLGLPVPKLIAAAATGVRVIEPVNEPPTDCVPSFGRVPSRLRNACAASCATKS